VGVGIRKCLNKSIAGESAEKAAVRGVVRLGGVKKVSIDRVDRIECDGESVVDDISSGISCTRI
jgi:hypothetical protein